VLSNQDRVGLSCCSSVFISSRGIQSHLTLTLTLTLYLILLILRLLRSFSSSIYISP
ncbi:hypothetical protein JMJ78_0012971, partial [Colletotrichum scovillei]